MVNNIKGFSTEEQSKLQELWDKFGAEAVSEWIKTLWKTEEVKQRIAATDRTAPVVEAPVETAPEAVVQEAPVEEVVETVKPTAPVKEKAPVVNQTAVDTEKELKSLDTLPLSNVIKDVFIKANEIGETKSQTVEKIKTRLAEDSIET